MIKILHINLIAGRSGSAGLCQSLVDSFQDDEFTSHQLVGYNFSDRYETTTQIYHAHDTRAYKTLRYKGAVGLNFLFEIMTPGHITYSRLVQQDFYQSADIIHLHSIQGGYFDRHDLDKISQDKKIIMTLHDDRLVSGHDKDNNLFPYKTMSQYMKRKDILDKVPITYIGVSDWISQKVQQDSIRGDNRVVTIYNGIDTSVFTKTDRVQAREKLGLPLDKILILSIAGSGSKSKLKGLQYVQELAHKYKSQKNILFITVGNHTHKNCDNILELPFVSQKDMALYFSACDFFLYPTLADSFGLVVAESLSCGCPVLTFRTGGVPEIIRHKKNSYIANYKDNSDLRQGFDRMLENSKNLNVQLEERFSLQNMISQYRQLYEDFV